MVGATVTVQCIIMYDVIICTVLVVFEQGNSTLFIHAWCMVHAMCILCLWMAIVQRILCIYIVHAWDIRDVYSGSVTAHFDCMICMVVCIYNYYTHCYILCSLCA